MEREYRHEMKMEFRLGGMVKLMQSDSLPHHGMTMNMGANGTRIKAKVQSVIPGEDMIFVVELAAMDTFDTAILEKEGWKLPN